MRTEPIEAACSLSGGKRYADEPKTSCAALRSRMNSATVIMNSESWLLFSSRRMKIRSRNEPNTSAEAMASGKASHIDSPRSTWKT
ncbi:Uncharacterised protein [Bordetella pertussis]|nr:Uncharacterised protein [Bordetella pertussis]